MPVLAGRLVIKCNQKLNSGQILLKSRTFHFDFRKLSSWPIFLYFVNIGIFKKFPTKFLWLHWIVDEIKWKNELNCPSVKLVVKFGEISISRKSKQHSNMSWKVVNGLNWLWIQAHNDAMHLCFDELVIILSWSTVRFLEKICCFYKNSYAASMFSLNFPMHAFFEFSIVMSA